MPLCRLIPLAALSASLFAAGPIYGVDGSWGIVPDDIRAHAATNACRSTAIFRSAR